jgi:uncharacterized protein (DUF1800 family)
MTEQHPVDLEEVRAVPTSSDRQPPIANPEPNSQRSAAGATLTLGTLASAALTACGGGEDAATATTAPGGMSSPMAATLSTSRYNAWRFLMQATMGPAYRDEIGTDGKLITKIDEVAALASSTPAAWLDAQLLKRYSNAVTNGQAAPGSYAAKYLSRVPGTPTNTITTFATPLSVKGAAPSRFGTISGGTAENEWSRHVNAYIWDRHLDKDDQVRQRVVYALSQFLVVSLRNEILGFTPMLVAGYLDMLSANAFGSFKALIRQVCTSPAMGYYLTHLGNLPPQFADEAQLVGLQRIPDQNFARELLQLFTIGLTKLNMDGTEVKDAQGNPIPATTTEDIITLSNVMTGWSLDDDPTLGFNKGDATDLRNNMFRYRGVNEDEDGIWYLPLRDERYDIADDQDFFRDHRIYWFASRPPYRRSLRYVVPMKPHVSFDEHMVHELTGERIKLGKKRPDGTVEDLKTHSTNVKVLAQLKQTTGATSIKLLGSSFSLGADPAESLDKALDRIFAHPNLAPFIAKQMIQQLVTSNPSPTYVREVATAFKNSTNWDMTVLIKSILLHREARQTTYASSATYGRLKDPYLRVMQAMRAIGVNGLYPAETFHLVSPVLSLNLNQSPMWAPSVFNDYSPFYVQAGGDMAKASKVSPQMQIATESAVIAYANSIHEILFRGIEVEHEGPNLPQAPDTTGDRAGALHLQRWMLTPLSPSEITARINDRLFGGAMSAGLKALVLSAATGASPNSSNLLQRLKAAVLVAMVSTEYMIQL